MRAATENDGNRSAKLGLEPGPDLQRLLTQILNQDQNLELAPRRHPDHGTRADAPRTNLRLQLTSFIGREREVAEVRRLLDTTRLLTLIGAGGVGKTHLALEVAGELLGEDPDGVWLVELAALADPSLVPQAAAYALGVREQYGRPILETLLSSLKARQLLLVLDKCEHLLEPCAHSAAVRRSAAEQLLACPACRRVVGGAAPAGTAPPQPMLMIWSGS